MLKQLLAAALLGLSALAAQADIVNIDTAETARLAAAGTTVIDVRTRAEWQESGVIANSKLITFVNEQGKTDPAAWLAQVKAVSKPGQAVVLICRSGRRSQAAAQLLVQQPGFPTIYNSSGGMDAWRKENRPVVAPGK